MNLQVRMTPAEVKTACVEYLQNRGMNVVGEITIDAVVKTSTIKNSDMHYVFFVGANANIQPSTINAYNQINNGN